MNHAVTLTVAEATEHASAGADVERLRNEYRGQNEFVYVKSFLPREVVEASLVPLAEHLRPRVHRSWIPGHKKGGSVSYYLLREEAPAFLDLYRSTAFLALLSRVVDARLMLCPENDPHSCALYYYTDPGDHIGFHYDTSYYKGARYTVLLGLVSETEKCQLVCQLYKDDPARETTELRLTTEPGDMVLFNGDKLWHAVTPLAAGERRVALTMEYVTNQEMGRLSRTFSNLKDAFAYFGVRTLLRRRT